MLGGPVQQAEEGQERRQQDAQPARARARQERGGPALGLPGECQAHTQRVHADPHKNPDRRSGRRGALPWGHACAAAASWTAIAARRRPSGGAGGGAVLPYLRGHALHGHAALHLPRREGLSLRFSCVQHPVMRPRAMPGRRG